MKRAETRRVLGFVLLVLICGSGCIMPRAWGPMNNDLAWVGLDEHTRARLEGSVDPRPNDPEPVSGLYGKLIIYPFTDGIPSNYSKPNARFHDQSEEAPLQFAGITETKALTIHWEQEVPYPRPEDYRAITATEYQQALLNILKQEQADLLLVYVVTDQDRNEFDATLSILPILTLGLAPTTFVSADMTLEAALIDAKTGYIYAVLGSEGDGLEITNFWNRYDNESEAQSEALSEGYQSLIEQLEEAWPMIQQAYP